MVDLLGYARLVNAITLARCRAREPLTSPRNTDQYPTNTRPSSTVRGSHLGSPGPSRTGRSVCPLHWRSLVRGPGGLPDSLLAPLECWSGASKKSRPCRSEACRCSRRERKSRIWERIWWCPRRGFPFGWHVYATMDYFDGLWPVGRGCHAPSRKQNPQPGKVNLVEELGRTDSVSRCQ
jgi:hypothetical protein